MSISDIPKHSQEDFKFVDFFEFPLFFGLSIFMFEGDVVALNIEDSMIKPKSFFKVSLTGLSFVTIMCCLMCIIPYTAYTSGSEDVIIDSLRDNWIATCLKVAYTTAIACSVPLMMYPISETVYRSQIFDSYFKCFRERPKYKFYIGAAFGLLF